MKLYYEAPEAEVIDFKARENLAVVEHAEDVGPTPEIGVGSLDFDFS